MSQGKQTKPEVVEKVKAVYAETNNHAEAARKNNLSYSTAYQIIKTSDDFDVLRYQVRMTFIKQGFEPMMKTLELTNQKVKELQEMPDLKRIDLKELTGALKDLKTSMENVGNTINVIGTQNNQQNNYGTMPSEDDPEVIEESYYILSKKHKLSIDEVKRRFE